jgi:hypothetical protein
MKKFILYLVLILISTITYGQTTQIPSAGFGGVVVNSSSTVSGTTYLVDLSGITDPTSVINGTAVDASGDWVVWKDFKRYIITNVSCGTCFIGSSQIIVEATADSAGNGIINTGAGAIIVDETNRDLAGFIANLSDGQQQALSAFYLNNLEVILAESGASDAVVINVPTSATLAVGTVVSNDGTGNYAAIDTSSAIAAHGLIREDNGARANVVTEGKIAVPSHGKTLHVPLYVSETAGELTETQYDENVQPIAIAFTTDSLLVTSKMMLGGGFGGGSGGKFVDGTDPADAVYTAGNVGIGTATPDSKLQILNTANDDVTLHVKNSFTGKNSNVKINSGNAGDGTIQFAEDNIIQSILRYDGGLDLLYINNGALGADKHMVINGDGGIGINNDSPDASSILDIESTSKGILIPRMTTTERNNIATPATGLQVYDTDTKSFWYYDGTSWKETGAAGLNSVNTIADLKLLTDTVDNFKVTVLGYYTIFDGNGGEFVYDEGNVSTANDGTIIEGTGVGGRWLRVVNGNYLSLKWFGAVGDSSTVETTAIQAWQSALASEKLNGYIPEGNYVYSDPAQNPIKYENVKIYGDGAKSSFVTRNAKTIFCLDSLSNNVYFRNFRVLVEDESGGGIGSTDGVFACPQGNSQYLTWEKIIIKSEGKLDAEVGMNAIAFRSQYDPYLSDSISHVTIKDCDFFLGGRNNYGIYFLIKTTDFYIENTDVIMPVTILAGNQSFNAFAIYGNSTRGEIVGCSGLSGHSPFACSPCNDVVFRDCLCDGQLGNGEACFEAENKDHNTTEGTSNIQFINCEAKNSNRGFFITMRDSIGNLTPPDDISIINCRSINNNNPIVINSNNGAALNHFGRGYPSNITIQNFESDRGPLIAYDVDTLHVVNSIFKNTDWILGKTVDFSARNVTIDNCVLTQAVTGIFAEHIDGLFKLSNTVIDSTLSHGIYVGPLSASDKMTIQNNEFYRIGNSGMELRATGNPITVTRNNTIQKTGGNAILCNQGDQSIVHDNTCFGTGNFNVTNGGTVRDNININ